MTRDEAGEPTGQRKRRSSIVAGQSVVRAVAACIAEHDHPVSPRRPQNAQPLPAPAIGDQCEREEGHAALGTQLAEKPQLEDVQVTQFALDDGWVGVALGPRGGANYRFTDAPIPDDILR